MIDSTLGGAGLPTDGDGAAIGDLVEEICRRVTADTTGPRRAPDDTTTGVRQRVDAEVRRALPLATGAQQLRIANAAEARLTGLGELDEWVRDPTVDEVLVNASNDIWIDRGGTLTCVGKLRSQPLTHIVERILAPIGRRLDLTSPIVDARLADGSRVCAVASPIGVDGTCLSIRRFAAAPRSLAAFTDDSGVELVGDILRARCNVVVAGATSSGKTSLLASIVAELPPTERVVVIEDTAELPVANQHVVRLEARPASPDGPPAIALPALVRTALRLRPDRLIVGEIRGDEVLGMVQAMNTGHDGSCSTCHANGPLDALYRLESLVLRAAPTWPMAAIRQQLARSIDMVVHVARSAHGHRRIDSISEVMVDDAGDGSPAVRRVARLDGDRLIQVADIERRRWP